MAVVRATRPNSAAGRWKGRPLDRVVYGAWLAHRTSLPILVSGSPGEAAGMKATLTRDLGVPPRWIEGNSHDTYQNAEFSTPILHAAGIHRILLVTTGTHEWRAAHEFMAAGFDVVPAPVNSGVDHTHDASGFFPNPDGLNRSYTALYEMLGEPVRQVWPPCISAARRLIPDELEDAVQMDQEPTDAPILVEVYRSRARKPSEERALVLAAVGIQSTLTPIRGGFVLWVAEADAPRAIAHLRQYDIENVPLPPPPPPPRLYPYAWLGCLGYVLCLMGVAFMISAGWPASLSTPLMLEVPQKLPAFAADSSGAPGPR